MTVDTTTEAVEPRLISLIRQRTAIGVRKYGEPLRTNNGRDATRDALEEALDLCQYLMQRTMEADAERDAWRERCALANDRWDKKVLENQALAAERDAAVAERDKYRPYYDAVRAAHNGYTAKGEGDNPVPEPATPKQALRELNEEWEKREDVAIDGILRAEAERDEWKARAEAAEAIVERLPTTADGKRYDELSGSGCHSEPTAYVLHAGSIYEVRTWRYNWERDLYGELGSFRGPVTVRLSECYSTREAAIAAREAKENG